MTVASDRESQQYAKELSTVLVEAGWAKGTQNNMIGRASSGLGVVAARDDIPRAVYLFSALTETGVPCIADIWAKEPPDTVILFVGEKP